MNLRPDEISQIIKEQIKNYQSKIRENEVKMGQIQNK